MFLLFSQKLYVFSIYLSRNLPKLHHQTFLGVSYLHIVVVRWQVTDYMWQVTCERCKVTHDMWHLADDTRHMTGHMWHFVFFSFQTCWYCVCNCLVFVVKTEKTKKRFLMTFNDCSLDKIFWHFLCIINCMTITSWRGSGVAWLQPLPMSACHSMHAYMSLPLLTTTRLIEICWGPLGPNGFCQPQGSHD